MKLILFMLLPAFFNFLAITLKLMPEMIYPAGKLIMLILPVWYWKKKFRNIGFSKFLMTGKNGILIGIATGIVFAVFIRLAFPWLSSQIKPEMIIERLEALNLREHYLIMAIVLSAVNSLFEEYYWRGFIQRMAVNAGIKNSVIIISSGVMFGVHHLVALAEMFPVSTVLLLSAGTSAAGMIWAWQRCRNGSLLQCYVSHMMADLAIYWTGWEVIS